MKDELAIIGVLQFKGSNGWLNRFSKRYSITSRRITGSGKHLPENLSQIIWNHIEAVNDFISLKGELISY